MGVAVSGDYVYVADYADGLRIIDVSNPTNPAEAGFFDTDDLAYGVAVSGNYAYVADYADGLRILDVSNFAVPAEVGFFDSRSLAVSVVVSGNYAYIADLFDGLRIIDVSIKSNPIEVGFFDKGGDVSGVAVSGGYAYLADGRAGLYIVKNDMVTRINSTHPGIPNEFTLRQNYPNPFNPTTTIKFEIPKSTFVTLKIYNVMGQLVATLVNEQKSTGRYSVTWNAKNVSSGIYLYRITAGNFSEVKKAIVLK